LFGSKEDLQLATLAHAREVLIERVVAPSPTTDEGLPRLEVIGRTWFDYLWRDLRRICAASAEMDARPGPVRDAVEATMREWLNLLEMNIDAATRAGAWATELIHTPSPFDSMRWAWRPTGKCSC
jgi:AcrR family transcriptional regulator